MSKYDRGVAKADDGRGDDDRIQKECYPAHGEMRH